MKFLKIILTILILNSLIFASEEVPTKEEIAKLYVATFNRAPDSAGLDYWVNANLKLSEIAQSFFAQSETQELYPSGTSNRDFVHSVYKSLFNRKPDIAGWDYWENELNVGSFSKNRFIEAVINGAQNSETSNDATILNNKTEVGLHFASEGLNDVTHAKIVMEQISDSSDHTAFIKEKITANEIDIDVWDSYIITHNDVSYGTVISPFTGKVWLDRNLGATQVCTSLDDTACYGDYYQWGRNTDGHENKNSFTTYEQAVNILNVGHDKFITSSSTNDYDWAQDADSDGSLRNVNWSKTDGSFICPIGYRVPTIEELEAETIDNDIYTNIDVFNSFLKLPSAGFRMQSGAITQKGSHSYLWSTSVSSTNSLHMDFYSDFGKRSSHARVFGWAVRCIKGQNTKDITAPVFISNKHRHIIENSTEAITLEATDESSVSYSITGTDADSFNVNSLTGVVTFKIEPDYEIKKAYTFTAIATDSSLNKTTQDITLIVSDVPEPEGYVVYKGLTYLTIRSPYTGKEWLDRNLGATQVCTSLDDTACYGDYYQWGRGSDGHENKDSIIISEQAKNISNVGHDKFIKSSSIFDYDWANNIDRNGDLRELAWSKIDGTVICPVGFRVPKMSELQAETINVGLDNNVKAYESFLKLPSAGYRFNSGSMFEQSSKGFLWSNTNYDTSSYYLTFSSNNLDSHEYSRTYGFPIRCIKDEYIEDASAPIFVTQVAIGVSENQTKVITLEATDKNTVTYSISGTDADSFNINSTTGVVTFKAPPDYEVKEVYYFTAIATDSSSNIATQDMTIVILDVDESISHNGISYEAVISPYTGKVWLDRNLGATQVCISLDDLACYGDYYQWGRNADGHENKNSTTTSVQALDVSDVGHSSYITSSYSYSYDWAKEADSDGSLRNINWSKTDGSSICPVGYRVPTIDELEAEISHDINNDGFITYLDAYNIFLKLPSGGYRRANATINGRGWLGYLWSSDVSSNDRISSAIAFEEDGFSTINNTRAYGYPIRCIQNK